ncbi:MAG: hypothetical protein ACXVEF_03770 [Polyangiales bacterium]
MRALLIATLGIASLAVGCGSDSSPPAETDAAATDSDTVDSTTTADSTDVDSSTTTETGGTDSTVGDADGATDTADTMVDTGPDTRGEPPIVHAIASVTVDTLAGSDMLGSTEGTGAAAQFNNPVGITFDPAGVLVVTEFDGGRVRKVTTAGATSLVASGILEPFGVAATTSAIYFETAADSTGTKGPTTGTVWKIVGAAAPTVLVTGLGRPRGIVGLADGHLVISDRALNKVSIVDPATKAVTLLAGSGTAGFVDGTGAAAQFNVPYGMALLPDGSIVIADQNNHCIRKITMAGVVSLFAGDRNPGMKDDADKLAARFDTPTGVATDSSGNVYVTDNGNHRIRRISSAGAVETVAGDGTLGFANGAGASAKFFGQEGIVSSTDGKTVYVADGTGGDPGPYHRIRRITLP